MTMASASCIKIPACPARAAARSSIGCLAWCSRLPTNRSARRLASSRSTALVLKARTAASWWCPLASDPLSAAETRRYARHLVLKGMGGDGQQKLKSARVLVVGAGGLGSPAIAYLAAAGVGMLGVVDDDEVSTSNLQRQIIHTSGQEGRLKTDSAATFVAGLNPHVMFEAIPKRITKDSARLLVGAYDRVLDGSDNYETRKAVAEAAEQDGRPLVAGAVSM